MRRTTLITGASSGLGAELARQVAAPGRGLALAARRADRLEALRTELLATHDGLDIVVRPTDVTRPAEVDALVAEAAGSLGGLDRVVVNAGVAQGGRIGSGEDEANRATVETNVLGAMAQCEAAMRHFWEQGSGHLVVISSVAAMRGLPGSMSTYAASKAFVAHLAEGIRLDLVRRSGHDIVVTTVFPGYIESEMTGARSGRSRLMVDTATGVRSIVAAIDAEKATAEVPAWPWRPMSALLRHAPLGVVRRLL